MGDLDLLIDALDASPTTMTRDVHRGLGRVGDYAIRGRYGHIYSDGDGYLLCVHTGESARRWSAIKNRLAFCLLRQDGDAEGALHLDHLPNADEADAIREALHIRKRRHLSPEAKAAARSRLDRFRAALNGGFPAQDAFS
jgi:hypothetical protein